MSTEEVIAQILQNSNIDIKDIEKLMNQKKEQEAEPKKIRLAPLSFGRVLNFFVKARERKLDKKIEAKATELNEIKDAFSDKSYMLSEKDAEKLAKKIARLEANISVLQYQKRAREKSANRALKIRDDMFGCMRRQTEELYKFTRNPFGDAKIKNDAQQPGISLSEQLNQRLDGIDAGQKSKQTVSLNDFAAKASGTDDKSDSIATSLETQLNSELDHVESATSIEDTPYNLKISPEEIAKINQKRREENARLAGEYHLKKDEIIQDLPFENKTSPDLSSTSSILSLPPREYHDSIPEKNESVNDPNTNQDYLGQQSSPQLDQQINSQPHPLEDTKEELQEAIASHSHMHEDDYNRNNYQKELDRVTELIERQAGLSMVAPNNNTDFSSDSSIEPLRDLMKLVEEEERKAQEVADQARLAKEEALQAAREKEESERLSAQTNERYEQLLREAKEAIESRSQRAKAWREQEQAELDRNRNLTAGIRRDAESIKATVAAKQSEISQLESVLGQYKTDTPVDTPTVSKR